MTFIIGQRWISNTESQLGLGIITQVSGRQVSISFPAAEEERIYAIDNAPLSRILFKIGDDIVTVEQQKLVVTQVQENEGLLFYTGIDQDGKEQFITEISLNCFIELSSPQERLFSGLLDKLNTFKLRIDTLNHVSRLQQSPVRGLLGSRTSHLPHQVYIASEVAKRYAPRVLLADEVGLGKTIEAGMILHYQLHTGRAQRVLIVVPDALIHQWLVEMIRRFNLYFSIFDEKRFVGQAQPDFDDEEFEIIAPKEQPNLFANEQLVLCSLEFLLKNYEAQEQAVEAGWDLLIVDEAHHLQWSEEEVSPQYHCIEELSARSKGLLLLTATPEQVGIESHFARLRLLDPARFYDFAAFKKAEQGYQEVNQLVQVLLEYQNTQQNDELLTELQGKVRALIGEFELSSINDIIKRLLDGHGTGRVLFRNTRHAIQGFPKRRLHAYPLPRPEIYALANHHSGTANLYPEMQVPPLTWTAQDPRVAWLGECIESLYPEKILVICAKASTAIALEQYLKFKKGIRSTAFHEGLSIIERDRAAAYFAEEEQGAQIMICSEIGSEGRNFQFSHHLVLFDLPLNPDLLEQRIGRLDRIGQRHTIDIHVPYLINTAQETLFRWFHQGIDLFNKSCSVGFTIFEAFKDRLLDLLDLAMTTSDDSALNSLIVDTKEYTEELNQILSTGRDRLLEMNSCNPLVAQQLITAIEGEENSLELESYMTQVFHEYGIDHEYHSECAEVLQPTEHMKTTHFPGLKDDGITVTYSRPKALVREDMEFLSWEHPMVQESMEMILASELGNATLVTISVKSIPQGTLFLEAIYTANVAAPKYLQLDRFLPLTPMRLLMNVSGKDLSKILSYEQLNTMCEPVKRHLGYPIIKQVRHDIEHIIMESNKVAEVQMHEAVARAQLEMEKSIGYEVERLEILQQHNPAIRDEEIAFFKRQIAESKHYLGSATLQLQSLRVIINK